MIEQLNNYLDQIRNSYENWGSRAGIDKSDDPVRDKVRKEMVAKFKAEVRYEEGNKYIKVIHGTSVHSFIVKADGEFKKGDILKAASWKTPARNFIRGNIFGDVSHIQWPGA